MKTLVAAILGAGLALAIDNLIIDPEISSRRDVPVVLTPIYDSRNVRYLEFRDATGKFKQEISYGRYNCSFVNGELLHGDKPKCDGYRKFGEEQVTKRSVEFIPGD